jgi:hypothetical protein
VPHGACFYIMAQNRKDTVSRGLVVDVVEALGDKESAVIGYYDEDRNELVVIREGY